MILHANTLPTLAAELNKVAEEHAARIQKLVVIRNGNYNPKDLEQAAYYQSVALVASDYATGFKHSSWTPQSAHRYISTTLIELYEEIGRAPGSGMSAKQRAQREVLTALCNRLLILALAAEQQQQDINKALIDALRPYAADLANVPIPALSRQQAVVLDALDKAGAL